MKKIAMFIPFYAFFCFLYQPDYKQNDVDIIQYEITSKEFTHILDSFLLHESQYEYYSIGDTCITFPVSVMDSIGEIIQLSSGHTGLFIPNNHYDSISGVFKYKGVWFLVTGRSAPSYKIIRKTNHKVKIPLKTSYNTNLIEDDTYFPTIWLLNYINGKLKIISTSKMEFYKYDE